MKKATLLAFISRSILNQRLLALLSFALLLAPGRAAESPDQPGWIPGETRAQYDTRMAWWTESKYGMFIHWGLYCIPADGEWHMRAHQVPYADYSKLAGEFNPTQFDANAWMQLAQDAGMKYVTLTTKHHDGFALFGSKASPYNVVDATPFKRDVVKELSEACRGHNLKFCTYYSFLADWGHPGGQAGCPHWDPKFQDGDPHAYIKDIATAQLKELLTQYGPLGVVWFDTDGSRMITPEESAAVVETLKTQPQIIVDPRVPGVKGDFATVEQHMCLLRPKGNWELCATVNGAWGYTGAKAKPMKQILPYMLTAWGMGGNVLMNVGPTRLGIIPEDSAERLRQIGKWLKTNGESIYGSTGGPFTWLPWGTATRKGDLLYLHVFKWPTNGQLKVPISNSATQAWLVADPKKTPIQFEKKAGYLLLHLPAQGPDPVASVIALQVEGEPVSTYASLALNKPVTASSEQKSASGLNDDNGESRWRNPDATGFFEVDLGSPQTFTTLRIAPFTDVKSYTLEAKVGESWKPIIQGKSLHRDENLETFPAVTTQVIRFSFKDEPKPPQIADFELYPEL